MILYTQLHNVLGVNINTLIYDFNINPSDSLYKRKISTYGYTAGVLNAPDNSLGIPGFCFIIPGNSADAVQIIFDIDGKIYYRLNFWGNIEGWLSWHRLV